MSKKTTERYVSGDPAVKTLHSQCRGPGVHFLIRELGLKQLRVLTPKLKIPHGQPRPGAAK